MASSDEYWDLFFDEVDTHLENLNHHLNELSLDPKNQRTVQEIFRSVHTIKGMAATIGFNSISKLCHKMEELFDYYRTNKAEVRRKSIDLQIKALDGLFKILEQISESGSELTACYHASNSLSDELDCELHELMMPQKIDNQTHLEKKIEVKVKFSEDCPMLGVRAFITTQVLEKTGEIIQTVPSKDEFLSERYAPTATLTAILKSEVSPGVIKEKLLKISDVIEVQVEESQEKDNIVTPVLNQSVKLIEGKECPPEIARLITEKQLEDIEKDELNIFYVDLLLAEDVSKPEEQFLNLLRTFNEYIGYVVMSVPTIDELTQRLNEQTTDTVFQMINAELDYSFNKDKQLRSRIQFILLIKGNHKNVLDFLSDSCELNKVEVKEILLPANTHQKEEVQSQEVVKAPEQQIIEEVNHDVSPKNDVKTTFVRVNLATLESLMNLIGELVINHNKIRLSMGDSPQNELRNTIQYLNQVTTRIQQHVMSIRMVPVNQVFGRFPRFIRDVSRELKKEVNLTLEGEQTEIDRIMVDELNDIFVHMVRNAIDHGIESPEEREAKGKPRAGLIKMQAYSHGNYVFVTISDDGKGIDPKVVKLKAIEKGLISLDQAEQLNQDEIMNLIFASGFSTADKVSNLSGRGVGMDVVRGKIALLGGQISVQSVVNEGTTIKLSIPSTISIIQALLINLASGLYAVALSEIKEIIQVSGKRNIYKVGGMNVLIAHEQTIPLIDLDDYVSERDIKKAAGRDLGEDSELLVIIVNSEERSYGLIVDSLIGQQEIVIKPISNRVNQHGMINGATVFADGRVAMILNVDKVIRSFLDEHEEGLSKGNSLYGMDNDSGEIQILMGK
jgi:two-component system chemotaxis sensor kinase CheA